jgi:phage/plasmid-associated DNA primase
MSKHQIKYTLKVWAIDSYTGKTQDFIKNNYEEYTLDELVELLETTDKGYHDRIDPNKHYKLFGDCDYYRKDISAFCKLLIKFLLERYNIAVTTTDIKYTNNKYKIGSYHYVIPRFFASVAKLKEIHTNFKNEYKDEFVYTAENGRTITVVDTSIYAYHWFRYPNQSRKGNSKSKHVIINGTMKDFVLNNIDDFAECLNETPYIENAVPKTQNNKPVQKSENKIVAKAKPSKQTFQSDAKNKVIKDIEWTILYKFFDECFDQSRFDTYDPWYRVGMAIKNTYGELGFELFRDFSNKGTKPDNEAALRYKYDSFKYSSEKPLKIGTLYEYAQQDNPEKYRELRLIYSPLKRFKIDPVTIVKYIKLLRPNDFVWKDNILYCYNGNRWEQNDAEMKKFVEEKLPDFLKDILSTCFLSVDDKKFNELLKLLDKLCVPSFNNDVVETSKRYFINNTIEFDNKWYLFGFTNKVLDLLTLKFRDYRYDDYVLTTTGYDWIEPSQKEVDKVRDLISRIQPIPQERQLFLEILSTGLEGRCLEKANIFNGGGRNGKGCIDDLAIESFGDYAMEGNNAILFEKNKTGSNPEKSNIHKKRLVLFREPPAKQKIENSVVKELTGGGNFSARGLYESNCKKKLHLTMILECNKKPLFAEEPQQADIERLIDLHFKSRFTTDLTEIDDANRVYLANGEYKTDIFKATHKTALLRILIDDAYSKYKERGYIFDIPASVKNNSRMYLQLSSNLLGWIDDNYEKTNNISDVVKLCDMYDNFTAGSYFHNLSKEYKRRYNKNYFITEISENVFLTKYYHERKQIDGIGYKNIITNYKLKEVTEYGFA